MLPTSTAKETAKAELARRKFFASLIIFMVLSGLIIRARPEYFPPLFAAYAPDIFWSILVFSLVVICAPRLTTMKAAAIALTIAYFMECSQLYQAPFINGVRDTRVGGLLLGHGFLWSDLLCYTVGVTLSTLADGMIRKIIARQL